MQPPANDFASTSSEVGPPTPSARRLRVGRLELCVAACAIVLMTAAVFGPPLSDPDAAGKYDVYRAFGPWSYFFDRSVQSGEFPEWNPLTLCGAPFAANPQTWALYPPNVLRALLHVHPTPRGTMAGLALLVLLHVCLLGFGTYKVARAHALSPSAAALAMMGASFNALVVRRAAELHFVFTLAWLPFMLLHARGFVHAETSRERLHEGTWLACYAALAVLGGFPQLYPYLAAGVLTYALVERCADPRLCAAAPTPFAARARALGKLLRQDLSYALPVLLITLALAACLLLPAEQFARSSGRITGARFAADGHMPEAWSLSYAWRSLVVFSGRAYEAETLRGAGIGVLALASAGVLAGVRRTNVSLLAALYVFIDLLIGAPMPIASVLAIISPFQMVSVTRAADVGLFFFALLAGMGLDALRSELTWRRAVAAVASLTVGGAALDTLHDQLTQKRIWIEPNTGMTFAPLVMLVGAMLVALAASRAPLLKRVLPLVLVGLVVAELLAWNAPYARAMIVHRNFQRNWLSKTDVNGKNPFWPDNRRHADERPNFELFTLRGLINGYDPLHLESVRRFLASKARSRRYERTVTADETLARNARGHLWMKRAFWLVPGVVVGDQPPHTRLFPPTEVAFVDAPLAHVPTRDRKDVIHRSVSEDAVRSVLKVPKLRKLPPHEGMQRGLLKSPWVSLPPQHAALELVVRSRGRLAIAPRIERSGGESDMPKEMLALELEVQSDDVVEHRFEIPLPDLLELRTELQVSWDDAEHTPELISLAVLSDVNDEDEHLEIVRRTADEVEVRARNLPAPRLLAFTDADYPGWEVDVDGRPASLVRTAGAFKGVELPAGSHDVRFHFRSTRLRLGLLLGALALVVSATLLWKTRRQRPASSRRSLLGSVARAITARLTKARQPT